MGSVASVCFPSETSAVKANAEETKRAEQQKLTETKDDDGTFDRKSLVDSLTKKLKDADQMELLAYEAELSDDELKILGNDINSIDFKQVDKLYKKCMKSEGKDEDTINPFPSENIIDVSELKDTESNELIELGYKAISNGECAIIILAGGQGSRLGFDKPKGAYIIDGLLSKKSIFEIHLNKLKKVSSIANTKNNGNAGDIPLYIMTSKATHGDTLQYLKDNNYFGYNGDNVKLFQQKYFPCMYNNGKIILKSKYEISFNPNGNGGIYPALKDEGILIDMKKRGVKYVQIFGVDNILAKMGDPLWFGNIIKMKADASNKTTRKTEPTEAIGVMCLRNNKPSVLEYSEITTEMSELKDDTDNNLLYSCGNLAMHAFSFEFLDKFVNGDDNILDKLPIHVAKKKIAYYDAKLGKTVPKGDLTENNGIKLEYFIFDSFSFADKMTAVNIKRSNEFAPVKNKSGKDSPATALTLYSNFCKQLLIKNGAILEDNSDDKICEISPLTSYDGEGLDKYNGKTIQLPVLIDDKSKL